MSRASVLTLVRTLSTELADQTTAGQLYDEVIEAWGQLPINVALEMVEHDASGVQFILPEGGLELLAVFYDDTQLSLLDQAELDILHENWRDKRGTPSGYVQAFQGDKLFRLFPAPDAPSTLSTVVTGEPFGADFPRYAITVLFTKRVDPPSVCDLPLAYAVLAREFLRESDHRDPAFAQASQALATLTLSMLPWAARG